MALSFNSDLPIVFAMLASSSLDGGLRAPDGNTRLMGSNSLDKDLDRYAFSNGARLFFKACSGLR